MSGRSSFLPVPDDTSKQVAKRIRRKDAIERAEMFTARHLPKYLNTLEALAFGVQVAEVIKGESVVYLTPPDRAALQYLVERGMGKVASKIELTGEEGGPVEILPWAAAGALTEVEDIEVLEGEVLNGTQREEALPKGIQEGIEEG